MVHAMPPFPYRRDQSKITSRLRVTLFWNVWGVFQVRVMLCGHGFRQLCFLFLPGGWHLLKIDQTIHWFVQMFFHGHIFKCYTILCKYSKKSGIRLYCNIFVIVWYLLLSSPIYFPFRVFPDRVIGNSLRRDFIYKVSDKKWENRSGCNECRIIMWNTVICWCGGK